MARTWFGEIPSSCSLSLLLGSAWVLLKYVLQTIFSDPVSSKVPSPTSLFHCESIIPNRVPAVSTFGPILPCDLALSVSLSGDSMLCHYWSPSSAEQ